MKQSILQNYFLEQFRRPTQRVKIPCGTKKPERIKLPKPSKIDRFEILYDLPKMKQFRDTRFDDAPKSKKYMDINDLLPYILKKRNKWVFCDKKGSWVSTEHKPILDVDSEFGWKMPEKYKFEGWLLTGFIKIKKSNDWQKSLIRVADYQKKRGM